MDLERIDELLSQLYNQAVALQEVIRLLRAGGVRDVVFTPDQTTQFTQKAGTLLQELSTLMGGLKAELGAA